jgi:hypothetical protein
MNGMNVKIKSINIQFFIFKNSIEYFFSIRISVIYRMKEFERERRLLQREHRKKASQEKESLENLE